MSSAVHEAAAAAPLALEFATAGRLAALRAGANLLAEIGFGAAVPESIERPYPHARIDLAQAADGALVEVWTSPRPLRYGRAGAWRYAANDEVLCALVSQPAAPDEPGFEAQVQSLYEQAFALIEEQGHPHLLRIWNYFPRIHALCGNLDAYQRFCLGRAQAFQDHYGDFLPRLSAATVMGTARGALQLCLLAARTPGVHRENPRQVSAYRYPARYGPRSPSFVRATLKRWGAEAWLFISGTASIVGHETRHAGDLGAQVAETLRNIDALIESTARDEDVAFRGRTDLSHLKVYLRDRAGISQVRAAVESWLGGPRPVLYLQGDVCRSDLLVEMEAVVRAVAR